MKHDKLIELTVKEMKQIFIPSSELLERSINYLIDNEYIQRDNENEDLLIYMS